MDNVLLELLRAIETFSGNDESAERIADVVKASSARCNDKFFTEYLTMLIDFAGYERRVRSSNLESVNGDIAYLLKTSCQRLVLKEVFQRGEKFSAASNSIPVYSAFGMKDGSSTALEKRNLNIENIGRLKAEAFTEMMEDGEPVVGLMMVDKWRTDDSGVEAREEFIIPFSSHLDRAVTKRGLYRTAAVIIARTESLLRYMLDSDFLNVTQPVKEPIRAEPKEDIKVTDDR